MCYTKLHEQITASYFHLNSLADGPQSWARAASACWHTELLKLRDPPYARARCGASAPRSRRKKSPQIL